MPDYHCRDHLQEKEGQAFDGIPLVPAVEFFETVEAGAAVAPAASCSFTDEREYRFCKAVVNHPLQPSSQYPKFAGVSSKTAVKLRRALVAKGFIREQVVDSGGRGRSTILLEPLEGGRAALAEQEFGKDGYS